MLSSGRVGSPEPPQQAPPPERTPQPSSTTSHCLGYCSKPLLNAPPVAPLRPCRTHFKNLSWSRENCVVGLCRTNSSGSGALKTGGLFAGSEMIIRGRSPTMRHVSRTHRVAFDWLFDRINLDPKIRITYVDTKNPIRRHVNQRKFHT